MKFSAWNVDFSSPSPDHLSSRRSAHQWHSKGGGGRGPSPPIFQTKHKHTYKPHKICQFDKFIFGKIIKIVATKSHLLKLKCTKFDFEWGSAPDPAGEAHSAPPHPLAGFSGVLLLTEGGRGGQGKKGTRGKRDGMEGRRGPPIVISGYTTAAHAGVKTGVPL